ncbi:MAG TPA: hypothetical protein VLT47_01790 [Anaeromyxobacteraceae bacterium]|nr:hypothetical protein [Anaeromyxobacteraceae bacterium]
MAWRKHTEALRAGDFRKLFEAFSVGAGDLAATLAPGAAPGEAHLVGQPPPAVRSEPEVDPLDQRLADLEREVERRRHRG